MFLSLFFDYEFEKHYLCKNNISRKYINNPDLAYNMRSLLYVFLGGGAGSVLRYMISMLGQHLRLNPISWLGQTLFPWPTLVANLLGCFLIGLFYSLSDRLGWDPDVRLLLTTGLCGGFTTFSTFSNEGLTLLRSGNYMLFALYFLLTLILGLLCVWAGKAIG